LRVIVGSASSCCDSTTDDGCDFATATSGISAATTRFSDRPATVILKSTSASVPTNSVTLRLDAANPGNSAAMSYAAGCSATARYRPSAPVTTVCATPFERLVIVTVTPGSAPPVSSVMTPLTLAAVDCADTADRASSAIRNPTRTCFNAGMASLRCVGRV
jgi:hypothetical protein